jgi:hypothetical protein
MTVGRVSIGRAATTITQGGLSLFGVYAALDWLGLRGGLKYVLAVVACVALQFADAYAERPTHK